MYEPGGKKNIRKQTAEHKRVFRAHDDANTRACLGFATVQRVVEQHGRLSQRQFEFAFGCRRCLLRNNSRHGIVNAVHFDKKKIHNPHTRTHTREERWLLVVSQFWRVACERSSWPLSVCSLVGCTVASAFCWHFSRLSPSSRSTTRSCCRRSGRVATTLRFCSFSALPKVCAYLCLLCACARARAIIARSRYCATESRLR